MTRWSWLASDAPALEAPSMPPALAGVAADATATDAAASAWDSVAMVHLGDEADTLQPRLLARFRVARRVSSSTTAEPSSSTDATHDTEGGKERGERFAHRHRAGSLCPLTHGSRKGGKRALLTRIEDKSPSVRSGAKAASGREPDRHGPPRPPRRGHQGAAWLKRGQSWRYPEVKKKRGGNRLRLTSEGRRLPPPRVKWRTG